MSTPIILPPKYYLAHFHELIAALTSTSSDLFTEDLHRFLHVFRSVSEDAQCVFVRMLNRKGRFFLPDQLIYEEILDSEAALRELQRTGLICSAGAEDWSDLLTFFSRDQLFELCRTRGLDGKRSWTPKRLREVLRDVPFEGCSLVQAVVKRRFEEELSYLLFLFFGVVRENLSLYTMRDLGLREVRPMKRAFQARFSSREEARTTWFYARASIPEDIGLWPSPVSEEAHERREKHLMALAETAVAAGDQAEASGILRRCQRHPGRERYARLLFETGEREACRVFLEGLLEDPVSDAEYLFAEDFYARKFQGQRRSVLTETLRNARRVTIDESFFRRPESGVLQLFAEQGVAGYFTENDLWQGLFGVYFWEELFESESSGLYSEFDRTPSALRTGQFYALHQEAIDRKLDLLEDRAAVLSLLRSTIAVHGGTKNGVFRWGSDLPFLLETLVSQAPAEGLKALLLSLAVDFQQRSSGFPDLMTIEAGTLRFYEVKAPGDQLRRQQLLQLLALQKAGFEVSVLQVDYAYNPNQVYVVVDLETTGGQNSFHRVTEIGAVKLAGGEILGRFQTLVNPGRPIPREIQQLTGITNEMVRTAPPFREVADALDEFTRDAIFVAHNVAFDYGFLQREYERLDRRFVRPFVCTKQGMRNYYPGLESYGLKNLSLRFGINLTEHHRALADAEAAAGLLRLINDRRSELGPPPPEP